MKIDLCKIFEVEEGEEFKIEHEDGSISPIKYRVVNNIMEWSEIATHYEGDYCRTCFSLNDVAKIKNIIKLPKKKKFSQETLNFFKCINKEWEWIAKDFDGDIFIYDKKPNKDRDRWNGKGVTGLYINNYVNQSLFDQIQWEDEEPVYIDYYVER